MEEHKGRCSAEGDLDREGEHRGRPATHEDVAGRWLASGRLNATMLSMNLAHVRAFTLGTPPGATRSVGLR